MNNSKLIKYIKILSPKELKRLQEFVHSPYHNKHKDTKALMDYLYKSAPRFMHTRLEKERVFKVLFPKEKYTDLKMRTIMSYLLKVVETFIAIENFQANKQLMQLQLLKDSRERELEKPFKRVLQGLQKQQQKEPYKDASYFFNLYQIEYEVNKYIEEQQVRDQEPNLQELSDSLDAFYLINKLKYCCTILNYKNLATIDYRLPLVEEILQHLHQHDYAHIPIIAIYYHALLTLTESDDEMHFTALQELLQTHLTELPEKELQDIFVLSRNYCIKRINNGDPSYLPNLFKLYQAEIESGIILVNGYIPPSTYKNVVVLGLKLEEFEWTEQFIHNYKSQINAEFREATFSLNLARFHFSKKEYDKVIPLLHQISYMEVFGALAAKTILLETYYELEEEEALYSLLDSFQAFLKRKKVLAYHRTHHLNLIKFVRKMLKIGPNQKSKIPALKQAILDTPNLVDRNWLLEKVEEL